jgi:hypothetical protein
MEQIKYIEYKKFRPHTSKIKQIKPRPISNTKETAKNYRNIGRVEVSDFRPVRPMSSVNEKLNNKHWEKAENNVKHKVNENINDNAHNKGLYKFTQIDWSSMKKHNFLTNVGGSDVDNEIWGNETTQYTRFNNRPYSTITAYEERHRPLSSIIPIIPKKRISSPQIPEM